MTRYVALVDGKPGSYGLTLPDLPGCASAAATTDEVLRRATEADAWGAMRALILHHSILIAHVIAILRRRRRRVTLRDRACATQREFPKRS